jgi:cytochrome c oxidase assembly protein subunit 15
MAFKTPSLYRSMINTDAKPDSPWPHRAAVLLVCATFPLIWVGGLVTTYKAGMAVPDWPTTFGYNMFLYPWQTWIYGPWDLFIEHGHRMFGAVVGLLSIALLVTVFRYDRRTWVRAASIGALALVIGQGVLGGMRVRLDARLLAQIHGCVAPAFFALSVAMAVWTSRRWTQNAAETSKSGAATSDAVAALGRSANKFRRLAFLTTALAYVQLVLGSQLRHVRVGADTSVFRAALWLHLFVAAALAVHVLSVAWRAKRFRGAPAGVTAPSFCLMGLLVAQLCLGAGAWVVKYGFPANWFSQYAWAQEFVVSQESRAQALITTAHVATGSLILVTSLLIALRSLLLPAASSARPVARISGMGVLA